MTAEMRISKVNVCSDEANTLQGLQLTLTDVKTGNQMRHQPVGKTDCNVNCRPFAIDLTSGDYLQQVTFYFNASGGYGIDFVTRRNASATYGINDGIDGNLKKYVLSIKEYDGGPRFALVGFAGTIWTQISSG